VAIEIIALNRTQRPPYPNRRITGIPPVLSKGGSPKVPPYIVYATD
jgi:hypothetical protein